MMTSRATSPAFPRWFLLSVGSLMVFTILGAGLARQSGIGTFKVAEGAINGSVDLWFDVKADGSVMVKAIADQRVLDILPADGSGFVRGVMRGLFRQRMLHELDNLLPFRLVQRQDGRLYIQDLAIAPEDKTSRVELDGFGPSNTQAFAKLYIAGRGQRSGAARHDSTEFANKGGVE